MTSKVLMLGAKGEVPASFLAEAVPALRRGALMVFPTDTVYGVGADGLSREGSDALYRAKVRPSGKPLPYLIESAVQARRWAQWSPEAERLAGRFWPGPLTMVLPVTNEGRAVAGGPTIGLRVPRHDAALAVLKALGAPLASSSANRSGEPPAIRAQEALEAFEGIADFILLQEAALPGGASTVADLTAVPPSILRPGPISESELLKALER